MVACAPRVIVFLLLCASELTAAVEEPHATLSLDSEAPASHLRGQQIRSAREARWLEHLRATAGSFLERCNSFVARASQQRSDHGLHVERRPGQDVEPQLPQKLNQPSNAISAVVFILEAIIQACIVGVAALLYAMYKSKWEKVVEVPEGTDKDSLNGDFKYSLCSWYEAPCLSCFVWCCCAGIRWADSMRMLGKISFAVAVALWLGLEIGGSITGGLLTWVGITVVGMTMRQDIRKAFNMKSDNETFCHDCLSWCFCSCCTIIQEARQIEAAKVLGHDAVKNEKAFDDFSARELC